jgi:NADPH-dependent glutamate synthase beta subunit-like oxidoreductase
MPKLKIDNREVEVPAGATLLDAARKLGIDIPTLCFRDGCQASASCLVCMVKIVKQGRLVPACATAAVDCLEVESETAEVHQVRRTALELLLSDHLGDCLAPCWFGCPAHMDIAQMLRQIAAGQLREAIATVKRDIALPGVLGRICSAPCEKICRRGGVDAAVAICLLKRYVADVDAASGNAYVPPCRPSTGKRVAIVGAGPAGLAAAYYLAQLGHACTIFDENDRAGGRLRHEDAARLPAEVLDGEIDLILQLGVQLRCGARVGCDVALDDLRRQFDAVLLACGAAGHQQAAAWGLSTTASGIEIDRQTFATPIGGLFAAGNAVRGKGLAVRSVADGKEAAASIDQFLCGMAVTGPDRPLSTKMGRLEHEELLQLGVGTCQSPRREPASDAGFTPDEAAEQAARCMHCDCRAQETCKLRYWAARYDADPKRYAASRRPFQQDSHHAKVIFEPGKCIDCGLCIQIAAAAGEPLGLSFVGRGFDVRVSVPFDSSLLEGLRKAAAACVAACPTAALAWKDDNRPKK